ncbi:hypothetical protein [Actinoplanes sp. NPDC023714]|uniref:hypothetical protein n=1 Tax=Actinoplanes sp. NPDC023714 TaxID=3154322 RepID=UPI0033C39653
MRTSYPIALVLVLAILAPSMPATAGAPPDGDLLTAKDLPRRYAAAGTNPYAGVLEVLDHPVCGLNLPEPARTATFVTRDRYALDVETLTEELAAPGARAARDLVATVATLPARCATFETPRYTVHVTPEPLTVRDATALRFSFWVKAAGSQTTYVDVMEAEVAVAAHREHTVAVVLLGYYRKHAANLGSVLRTAIRRA